MHAERNRLTEARRIVVKVGTSTLTYDTGKVNFTRMEKLVRVLADLMNQGKEIVLVTSGAIGIGVGKLKLSEKPKDIGAKQAVAAVGQCELMHIYSKFFGEYGHIVGQILLTRDVVEQPGSRKNVINTFENLIQRGIVPVVNENDSISIEEIEKIKHFGDNDTLSAVVAELVRADLLIILSDIDGLYNGDPRTCADACRIPVVSGISRDIENMAGGAGSKRGTGGMATKISAAKIATQAGVAMVIANGASPELVFNIIQGEDIGTLFTAEKDTKGQG